MNRRGVLLPLFSAASTRSWGIGDCADVRFVAEWLASAGFTDWMLLPLGTMADGQCSPYSACTAMAIDPIYIAVGDVDDFLRAGGVDALESDARAALAQAQWHARVDYAAVRFAKRAALERAFAAFFRDEWGALTTRASRLAAFISRERWWLDDYALYRALARQFGGVWTDWPPELAARDPRAMGEARRRFATDMLREQYLQWIAHEQWQHARRDAASFGIRMYGDMPFTVEAASADVWTRADEFDMTLSAGVPPDAFSETGQDWGLPVYRWDTVAATGFEWLRQRAARASALFDGVRLDHLVGFFRSYARAADGRAWFTPADEPTQRWQGAQVIAAVRSAGIDVLAEDLGVIPDFVRATLAELHLPGYKVFRWERDYDAPGQPFRDPASYPVESVAATGTHDTETQADWWDTLSPAERQSAAGIDAPWSDKVRDHLLTRVLRARSAWAFLPMQDLFGWRDRINTPATVGDHNWTWKLPWPSDSWHRQPEAAARAAFCRRTITRA